MAKSPAHGVEYWPGTSVPKSTNNGFTHGFGDTPHGFNPDGPVRPSGGPRKRGPRTAAPSTFRFGSPGGTIEGLGVKRV